MTSPFLAPGIPTTPATTSAIDAGDCSLHVTTYAGHGPELLLIHGIGSSSAGWHSVIDDLARDFSPITVDLRGHGQSDNRTSRNPDTCMRIMLGISRDFSRR